MEVEKKGLIEVKVMEELVVIEYIEDMYNVLILILVLKNMINLNVILDKVNSDCNDWCFNVYDILIM